MKGSGPRRISRGLAQGTALGFAAELLAFPAALVAAAYLTRSLGPTPYGRLSIIYAAVSPAIWIASTTFAGHVAVKLIVDAVDWKGTAAALLRANLLLGLACTALFVVAAPILAEALGDPGLSSLLRLASLEILLMPIARLHRDAHLARSEYRWPAVATSAYQFVRLVLILGLVAAGWAIEGVITANLGARAIELGAYYVRQPIPLSGARRGLLTHARPLLGSLLLYSLCLQLFNRMDLLLLGVLDAPHESLGHFGAAQNLTLAPGLLALVFSPMLIAALRAAEQQGGNREVTRLRLGSARLALVVWALSVPVAGGSSELVILLFGNEFASSGPILSLLAVGAGASFVLSVLTAQEVARGHHRRPLLAAVPMFVVALVLHMLLIPQLGALGAAWGTAASAGLAALVAQWFSGRHVLRSRLADLAAAAGAGVVGLAGTRLASLGGLPSPLDLMVGCLVTVGGVLVLRLVSREELGRTFRNVLGIGDHVRDPLDA